MFLNLQTIIRHIANLILWHAATVAADKLARQTRAVGRFIRLVLTVGNSVAPMKDDVNWATLSIRTVTKNRKIPNRHNWTILTRRSIETCRVRRHTSNSPHCRLFKLNHRKYNVKCKISFRFYNLILHCDVFPFSVLIQGDTVYYSWLV